MEIPTDVQKVELIEILSDALKKRFDESPLSMKFPDVMRQIYDKYHFLAVILSTDLFWDQDIIRMMVSITNKYYHKIRVSQSNQD